MWFCVMPCRSLDSVTPPEPTSDFERTVSQIQALRESGLSQEQHDILDKKIYDALHSAGMFNLEDEEGNKVKHFNSKQISTLKIYF